MTTNICNAVNPLTCRYHGHPEARALETSAHKEVLNQEKALLSEHHSADYISSIEKEKEIYVKFAELYGFDAAQDFETSVDKFRNSVRSHPSNRRTENSNQTTILEIPVDDALIIEQKEHGDDAIDDVYITRNDDQLTIVGTIKGLNFKEGFSLEIGDSNADDFLNQNYSTIEANLKEYYDAELDGSNDDWSWQTVEFAANLNDSDLKLEESMEILRTETKIIDAHNSLNGGYQSPDFWSILLRPIKAK